MSSTRSDRWRRWAPSTFASALALLVWLPLAHLFFSRDARALGRALTAEQVAVVQSGRARALRAQMQEVNPEWDFMGRTFAALAFANRALDHDSTALAALDTLIGETLAEEREHGARRFLLPYVDDSPFLDPSGRSLFVDGEIALMLAARQAVQRDPRYDLPLAERMQHVAAQLRAGPVLSGESYPDECWTFCNTTALVALRVYDAVYGQDHSALLHAWVDMAKQRLIDPATGLLVSSHRYDGTHLDGPEGSTIWMVAHNLLLVDPEFARAQYQLARQHLAGGALGFAWSREWPARRGHVADVDSGPVIPGFEISAGASGLAFVGAGAFGDDGLLAPLVRSLQLGGFPTDTQAGVRLAAGNQVAEAVIAYGLTQGPLWRKIGPAGTRPAASNSTASARVKP